MTDDTPDIAYEPDRHRLRVAGACRDVRAVCAALEAHAGDAATLTLDLTGVTDIDAEAATALVDSVVGVEQHGCTVTLVRKHGSDVDRVLQDLAR